MSTTRGARRPSRLTHRDGEWRHAHRRPAHLRPRYRHQDPANRRRLHRSTGHRHRDKPGSGGHHDHRIGNDGPTSPGSGYTFLGHQLDITAPFASTADPLTLVFTIDASLLASVDPDLTADTINVFRDGVPVQPCTTSSADDPATPDPCVSLRQTLSAGADAGDARITVLSSAASHWNFGTRAEPGSRSADQRDGEQGQRPGDRDLDATGR